MDKRKFVDFLNNFETLVYLRRGEILRLTNVSVTDVMWKIGEHLNSYLQNNESRNHVAYVHVIQKLINRYGPYLKCDNVEKFQRYSDTCKKATADLIASVLGMHYLEILLPLEKYDKIVFYARTTIVKQLSVDELQDTISKNLYESSPTMFIKFPDYPFFDISPLQSKGGMSFDQAFGDVFSENLRHLLEPKTTPDDQPTTLPINLAIDELITKFSKECNVWLNFKLNTTFYELGQILLNSMDGIETGANQDTFLFSVSNVLHEKYGNIFSMPHIKNLAVFAALIDNNSNLLKIAEKLTWQDILKLTHPFDLHELIGLSKMPYLESLSVISIDNLQMQHNSIDTQKWLERLPDNAINIYQNNIFFEFLNTNKP